MSWYWWKKGPFAWACGSGRPFRSAIHDSSGRWVCLVGKLFLRTSRQS